MVIANTLSEVYQPCDRCEEAVAWLAKLSEYLLNGILVFIQ